MKEARPQHKLTYVCREGRTVSANTNGGVVLLRPLYREESCRYQRRMRGKVAEASEASKATCKYIVVLLDIQFYAFVYSSLATSLALSTINDAYFY